MQKELFQNISKQKSQNLLEHNSSRRFFYFKNYFSSVYEIYFAIFIASHLIIWTILPLLIRNNLNLDPMECVAWGHEWQFGYHKHPPLCAWLSESAIIISGKKLWSIYLLSQICIVLAFVGVWKLAKLFLSQPQAFLATILLELVYYYNFTSPEFNPNVLMITATAWFNYFAWKIYDKKNYRSKVKKLNFYKKNQFLEWLILALIAVLGVLSKYTFLITIFCFAIILVIDKKNWISRLKNPAPYLSAILFIILLLPHIKWLVENDFINIEYIKNRSKNEYHLYNHFLVPALFLLAQFFALIFAIIIFSTFFKKGRITLNGIFSLEISYLKIKKIFDDKKKAFLILTVFAPLLFLMVPSVLTGNKMKDMWGSALWNFFGIFLFYFYKPKINNKSLTIFYRRWAVFAFLPVIIYAASNLYEPDKYSYFDGRKVAKEITDIWHENNENKLEIVVGNIWLAGNINLFSKDRPHVFIDLNEKYSPWLKIKDLEEKGGVILWESESEDQSMPAEFKEKIKAKIEEQPPIISPFYAHPRFKKTFHVGWAIVEPISAADNFDH